MKFMMHQTPDDNGFSSLILHRKMEMKDEIYTSIIKQLSNQNVTEIPMTFDLVFLPSNHNLFFYRYIVSKIKMEDSNEVFIIMPFDFVFLIDE